MATPSIHEPIVADLLLAENYSEPPGALKFVATHASFVLIGERRVYKIKRAKDYGFFDYSTLAHRKRFCDEEARLNRRLAPEVYLDVVPVYRDAQGYSFNRPGEVADYAVRMKRLPDEWSALSLARAGTLTHAQLGQVAARLARFYASAPAVPAFGSAEIIRKNVEENFDQVQPYIGKTVAADVFRETRDYQEQFLEDEQLKMGARVAAGRIRDGHGDLRLEHVYLAPEGPLIIDCIEFLDRFRFGDTASDVAFLGMDLYLNVRADLAEYFFGAFAFESDDYGIFPLLDFYMSYRAWVRGKVASFLCADPAAEKELSDRKRAEAQRAFSLAHRLVSPGRPRPRLIAVGGIIGSGKTTLSRRLAERLAAPLVMADATRKFLAGAPHEQRLPEKYYTQEFSERVQDEMLARASSVIGSGRPVILDTTFAARALRLRVRELARQLGAEFLFVECRAPEEVCRARLQSRAADVSDAGVELLERFIKAWEPVTELATGEHKVADTTRTADEALAQLKI